MSRDIAELGVKIDTSGIKQGDKALEDFSRTAGKAETATDKVSGAVGGLGKALAAVAAAAAAVEIGKQLYEAAAAAERLNIAFKFSFGPQAQKELQAIRKVSNDLGLQFQTTAIAYGKFSAAAKGSALEGDKARQIFLAVSKASAVMGLTAEQSSGALLALEQMISKGVVSAEELRGQLGERLPGTMDRAARAMGMTTEAFNKFLATGSVLAEDFLPKFAAILDKDFSGSAESAADRLDAATNRMGNAWQRLKTAVAESGVSEALKKGMQGLTNDMTAVSEAMEGAKQSGAGFMGQMLQGGGMLIGRTLGLQFVIDDFKTIDTQLAVAIAKVNELNAKPKLSLWDRSDLAEAEKRIALLTQYKKALDGVSGGDVQKLRAIDNQQEAAAAKERARAESDLADIRRELSKVDKDYLPTLQKLQSMRQAGVVTESEYIALVSDLAQKNYKKSESDKEAAKAAKESREELERRIQSAKDYVATLEYETQVLGKTEQQQYMMNAARKAAEAPTVALRVEIMRLALAYTVEKKRIDDAEAARKDYVETLQRQIDAQAKELASSAAAIEKLQIEVETYGQGVTAVTRYTIAKLKAKEATLEATEGTEAEIAAVRSLIGQQEQILGLQERIAKMEGANKFWTDLESAAHQTFLSIQDGGKNLAERLKATMKNVFFEWLYKMTLQKWIINVGISAGATGGTFGTAQAAGMGSDGMSYINVGQKIYEGFTSGFSTAGGTLGTAVSALGNMFGSASVSAFGAGMGLTGTQAANAAAAYSEAGMSTVGSSLTAGSTVGAVAGPLAGIAGGIAGGRMISGGYSAVGKSGNTAVNVGTIAGAILGGPVGALIGGMLGGTVNRLFGRKPREETGRGITGTFGAEGFTGGQSFTNWLEKGGVFRSDKRGTDVSPLSQDAIDALTAGFLTIQNNTVEFAKVLGASADDIIGYSKDINLELTQDTEKNKELLAGMLADIGNELADKLLPNLAQFKKEGESSSATLERLVVQYKALDALLATMGGTFGAVGIASIEARNRLVDMAGGIEALAQQTDYFAENFLTAQQRMAPVQKQLTDALSAIGMSDLTTMSQFKNMVHGLATSGALATEEGSKLYTTLLSLGPQFKQVADYATQVSNAAKSFLKSTAENALGVLQRAIASRKKALDEAHALEKNAADAQIKIAQDSVSKLQSLSKSLHATLMQMAVSNDAQASRARAQEQLRTALSFARAGVGLDEQMVQDSLSILGQQTSGMFETQVDLERDFYRTAIVLSDLAEVTDTQLSIGEQTLYTLKDTYNLAEEQYNNQILQFEKQLESAQLQIDALNGIDVSIVSVEAAITYLGSAITAANNALATQLAATAVQRNVAVTSGVAPGAGTSGLASTITGFYEQYVHRAPDPEGFQYWMDQAASGMALGDIANTIELIATQKGIPQFADGGYHSGGWRVVGENGPELEYTGASNIVSNQNMMSMLDQSGTQAAIYDLRSELMSGLVQIAKNTGDTNKKLDRVIRDDALVTSPAE